jgi:hypothetical protein
MKNRSLLTSAVGLLLAINIPCFGQSTARLKDIPGEFELRNQPASWSISNNALTINAAAKTNWFIAPLNLRIWDTAPTVLFRPADDFVFSANVSLQSLSR